MLQRKLKSRKRISKQGVGGAEWPGEVLTEQSLLEGGSAPRGYLGEEHSRQRP